MRVLLKLSAIILVGVMIQWAIGPGIDQLDQAAFDCRVGLAVLRGVRIDDPILIEEAAALFHRQCARDRARKGLEPLRDLSPDVVVAQL
jgi:hypothetical protein